MSIELRKVTKKFGEVSAVNNVSFSVKEGELMALLGPSGGGKTTVLRMIAGLEMPTSGDVFIRGQRVNDLSVQQRNIGFVFQNYALFKNMTVFKNIAFGLKIKKWKRTEQKDRVSELVKLFGLQGLEKRYPHQLSGGQRQRVAIARALASKPSVLLLDEPFGAVDAKIRQELREWLVTLHSDLNVTTIFVTHDQEEALEVSNRIVIFSRGLLEQVGTPRDVYEYPANEFVARFIGVMNVLEPIVDKGCGPHWRIGISRQWATGRSKASNRFSALRRADFARSDAIPVSRGAAAHVLSRRVVAIGVGVAKRFDDSGTHDQRGIFAAGPGGWQRSFLSDPAVSGLGG